MIRLGRIEGQQLGLQLQRIESKLEVFAERTTNKLEEHGHRLGEASDGERDLSKRLHAAELESARQQAEIDRLSAEATDARRIAETKGNRGVGQVAAAISAVALLLTIAQQLYTK